MSSSFRSAWGSDPDPESPPSDPSRPGPLDNQVAVDLLQRGQVLAEQGDWDLAAGTFARVVGADDPALHTAALLGLAECRYRLDDEPAALQVWTRAVTMDPDLLEAHERLLDLYLRGAGGPLRLKETAEAILRIQEKIGEVPIDRAETRLRFLQHPG